MKTFLRILITVVAAAVAVVAVLGIGIAVNVCNSGGFRQDLNYTESTEKIDNPDQGFYRPIYVKVTENGAEYNKNIVNSSTQLYHLRIDISAFSSAVNGTADKPLTSAALEGLKGLLSYLEEKEKSAIARLAYDPKFEGKKDMEPDIQTVLKHIEQFCGIVENYQRTVTAIEAGIIGPWGEMHSSNMAKSEFITRIMQAYLDNAAALPVLVRTPKMIYDYLGITVKDIENYGISAGQQAFRLGIYNDGYLGSNSDLGTYTDREKEIEFLSKQTEHLPYGGEVVVPDSPLHDIETCTAEMAKINLSYLNVEWNNQVIDKWNKTYYTKACGGDNLYYGKTAFEYIQNRLGYRLVLRNSILNYGKDFKKLEIKLNFENVGFGNMNKTYDARVIIADESGKVIKQKTVGKFDGSAEVKYEFAPDCAAGKYKVYLCVYGGEKDGTPTYAVKFANVNTWNEALRANLIGEINL